MSVHLAQGNVTGALALFRHALEAGLAPPSPLEGCEQCHSSLPLLRCLQFYPSLYNLSQRQPCPRESAPPLQTRAQTHTQTRTQTHA